MSEPAHQDDHSHSVSHYYRIYFILLGLLVVSIVGPMFGGMTVLLITAFGVAIVKATMVAAYFMHLNVEKKYIWYVLLMAVLFLLVMFYGVAPDVMNKSGVNWHHIEDSAPAAAAPAHH